MNDISYEQLKNCKLKVLERYDILQNDDGDILIVLPMDLPCVPGEPVFYYDGGKHGIIKGKGMPITVCDHIHKGIRSDLERREEIYFCVTQADAAGPGDNAAFPVEFSAPLYWQPGIQQLAEELMKTQ